METTNTPEDAKILTEAKDRFARCQNWESMARSLWLQDLKFANADADNGYQWPNAVRKNRDVDERPCLTINKVRQHNLQIINNAKQNKPGVTIRPVGNGATYESAQVLEDVVRHIEYISNAQSAYDLATTFQVNAGIGYIRVATDYSGDKSFDQEIYIRRVTDPLNVYMDPEAKEADKSDMGFCFVYDDMSRKEFEKQYPEYKDLAGTASLDGSNAWLGPDMVRVCEYFRKTTHDRKLVVLPDGTIVNTKGLAKELLAKVIDEPGTKWRTVEQTQVEWFLIVGDKIAEDKIWPGKYIPIVPVIGEETVIEGQMDRKGHTRAMKDAQRMYNYWSSSAVEHVALQGKTPWLATAESIEEYESMWNTANKVNHSVLIYNGRSDDGNPIPPPSRPAPPVMASAYIQGMQIAQEEIMSVSGQYQSQMGAPSNERSGKAINERQRQSDTSTYHYVDNLALAIRLVGKIILDLIPHIYDTQRIMSIMAESGESYDVEIDPSAKAALMQEYLHNGEVVKRVLNPNVGKYDVEADVGPAYGTRRQEAFNALTLILTQAPQLTSIIGDILLKNGDFPMADEAAQRLKRMVPPQALGTGPNQTEQQMMQQIQQLKELLDKTMNELALSKLKLTGKAQGEVTDVYKSETERLKILLDSGQMGSMELQALVRQLVTETLQMNMAPVAQASEPTLAAASGAGEQLSMDLDNRPPVPGARRGANGAWYAPDPTRSNRYIPVA